MIAYVSAKKKKAQFLPLFFRTWTTAQRLVPLKFSVFPLRPWDPCDSMNTIRPKKGKAVKMFLIPYTAINIPVKGICKGVATGEKNTSELAWLVWNSSQNVFHIFCILTHFTNLPLVPDLSTSYWTFRLALTSTTGFQILPLTTLSKANLKTQTTANCFL